MALTEMQSKAVVELLAKSFSGEKDLTERRHLISDFENSFDNSIREWREMCRSIMEANQVDQATLDEFDKLLDRRSNSEMQYDIRLLMESDLEQVRDIINKSFDMALTYFEDDKFTPFIKEECSFVAYHNDEIYGVVLAGKIPSIGSSVVFVDTLAVADGVRSKGIGRKLLQAVADACEVDSSYIRMRLCTEKTRPAYEIYKHLGFKESSLVTMDAYYIHTKWKKIKELTVV